MIFREKGRDTDTEGESGRCETVGGKNNFYRRTESRPFLRGPIPYLKANSHSFKINFFRLFTSFWMRVSSLFLNPGCVKDDFIHSLFKNHTSFDPTS